ncbi:hypothetical protein Dimus_011868 [Dionaea muscipula]
MGWAVEAWLTWAGCLPRPNSAGSSLENSTPNPIIIHHRVSSSDDQNQPRLPATIVNLDPDLILILITTQLGSCLRLQRFRFQNFNEQSGNSAVAQYSLSYYTFNRTSTRESDSLFAFCRSLPLSETCATCAGGIGFHVVGCSP